MSKNKNIQSVPQPKGEMTPKQLQDARKRIAGMNAFLAQFNIK